MTIASKDGEVPIIRKQNFLGANSVVIGGINIGCNVFIGALSIVNKNSPDNAIAFGIPAKVIRYRTEEELAVSQIVIR